MLELKGVMAWAKPKGRWFHPDPHPLSCDILAECLQDFLAEYLRDILAEHLAVVLGHFIADILVRHI